MEATSLPLSKYNRSQQMQCRFPSIFLLQSHKCKCWHHLTCLFPASFLVAFWISHDRNFSFVLISDAFATRFFSALRLSAAWIAAAQMCMFYLGFLPAGDFLILLRQLFLCSTTRSQLGSADAWSCLLNESEAKVTVLVITTKLELPA